MAFNEHSRKSVSYFHDHEVSSAYFGKKHPMKPQRIAMVHELIVNYGLYMKMKVFRPHRASEYDMQKFHTENYVSFLSNVTRAKVNNDLKNVMKKFRIGTRENDCPLFDGLFTFCQISSGGTLAAAANLNKGDSEICINWAGGLHHAKKSEASGFCYINDIVLGILELLKIHQRVLYVDIDVHHGDGVEEAFFLTDRVMTVSFHQFGDFFPGTGDMNEIGEGAGKYYSLNVPLKKGMDDESYNKIFLPIMAKVMDVYRPSAVVLQCGADSLTGDRLGDFNLTLKGHGYCVQFMRSFNVPLLLLGGGGYTPKNVSRCWTYETAIALNTEISDHLPHNAYFKYFEPDMTLHIKPDEKKVNMNTRQYLWNVIKNSMEKLRNIQPVPGVQMQDAFDTFEVDTEDKSNPDKRQSQHEKDKQVVPENEFYDAY